MVASIGGIGVWTPSWFWPDDERREAVAELEELGFGAVWIGAADGTLALAEELLDASTRLVVATGIVNIWTTSAPDATAAYHRVSARHGGRFLLGLGSSHAPAVEPTGQSYRKPYSKLVGYLDELDAQQAPVPHADIALAALGPRTLALAGERTAGGHPYLTTPDHTTRAREILGTRPLLAPEQKVVLETDPATARATAREGIAHYLALPNYVNNLRREGFTEADLADGGSDRLVDALVAWGDVDAIARRVNEHREAGADHVCVQVLTADGGLPRAEWRQLAPALLSA